MSQLSSFLGFILKYIYETISSIGTEPKHISYFAMTILIMTVLYKVVTLPVTLSNIKTQKINAKMAPEMKKIQEKYKNDPQKQQQMMAQLHKEHGFNPLAGCMPMIIQMVLVFALFAVMRDPGYYMFKDAGNISSIARNFFWISDLSKPDPYLWGLPLLNGLTQFLLFDLMQPKGASQDDNPMAKSMGSMKYIMPLVIFYSAMSFTAGLALYWAFGNVLEMIFRIALRFFDKGDEDVTPAKKGA